WQALFRNPNFKVDWLGFAGLRPCYGVPQYPLTPESVTGPQSSKSEPVDFEVWVSEESLPLAKWILDSSKEDFEKEASEESTASVEAMVDEVSPGTTGICPL